jgi:tRNA pseudouridine38-40 synthase
LNNYKLTIRYDGTNYFGWQIQDGRPTVQQTIADTIKILLKEDVNLIGSGRTDSGVHALGQVANFRTENEMDISKFNYSINAILPNDISILKIEPVDNNFHARFSAVKRSYLYFLSKFKSPFFEKYSYRYSSEFNIQLLNNLSEVFIGKHDFTSFCRRNAENDNKECIVYDIHWKDTKELVIFFIEANRFLHGMVRTIVGTILHAAKEKYDLNYINNIFSQHNRESAWEAVPAKGLFLYKVKY